MNNRDSLKRLNYPRATYALSGIDVGVAAIGAEERGKLKITNSPMLITPMPPGALANNNNLWKQTYGASMDSFLSIFDGEALLDNITEALNEFDSVYRDALLTVENANLYEKVAGKQQVQFVVSKQTIPEARAAVNFGDIDEARSICMRGPMHLSGWGRTIGMRPTDPEPEDSRINDNAHKLDRSSWKTGPVDIRWDDRRKCWRAFNDLIVDDRGEGLGTFVHSTNPHAGCGFPFLRGKLEDVWAVRKTSEFTGSVVNDAAREDDKTKSGVVCTRLDGLASQNTSATNMLVARWTDVLTIIPATSPAGVCGDESTVETSMVISAGASFYNGLNSGPLCLTSVTPVAGIGDTLLQAPIAFNGTTWCPTLVINGCSIAGGQFATLYGNDNDLQADIEAMADFINDNSVDIEDLADATSAGLTATNSAFGQIVSWQAQLRPNIGIEIGKAASQVYSFISANVQSALDEAYQDLLGKIFDAVQAVNAALAACECPIAEFSPEGSAPFLLSGGLANAVIKPNLDITTQTGEIGDQAAAAQGVAGSAASRDATSGLTSSLISPC